MHRSAGAVITDINPGLEQGGGDHVILQRKEPFVVRDYYRVRNDEVHIREVGKNFRRMLWGVVETVAPPVQLMEYHTLTEDYADGVLVAHLGESIWSALAVFWEFLRQQGRGQHQGLLTITGAQNGIFKKTQRDKCFVFARWENGWCVNASRVTGTSIQRKTTQIFHPDIQ